MASRQTLGWGIVIMIFCGGLFLYLALVGIEEFTYTQINWFNPDASTSHQVVGQETWLLTQTGTLISLIGLVIGNLFVIFYIISEPPTSKKLLWSIIIPLLCLLGIVIWFLIISFYITFWTPFYL